MLRGLRFTQPRAAGHNRFILLGLSFHPHSFPASQAGCEAGSSTASKRLYCCGDKCHANTVVTINNFSKTVKGSDVINCISSTCSVCGLGLNAEQAEGFLLLMFWKGKKKTKPLFCPIPPHLSAPSAHIQVLLFSWWKGMCKGCLSLPSLFKHSRGIYCQDEAKIEKFQLEK